VAVDAFNNGLILKTFDQSTLGYTCLFVGSITFKIGLNGLLEGEVVARHFIYKHIFRIHFV
jgi:hypothetical protein